MFNDDFWNDDDNEHSDSMETLLSIYEGLKEGIVNRLLEEEEFEMIIDYYFQENLEQEALQACDVAQKFYPFGSTILLYKAEILYSAHKHGQALVTLDLYDSLAFQSYESVLLRADILNAQQKHEEAAAYLESKKEEYEGKEKIEIMLELADIYDESEDYELVFSTLKGVLEIDMRNEEALHKISFWTDFAGLYDQGIALHQELIQEDPYNALAWFNLGAAFQGKKEYVKAIDAYEFCVAIDDKFEFAYRNMADAYMRLKWYGKAIESLEKNLELGKPEDVIYEAMAHCFEKQKDFSKARYFYRQAIALNPVDDTIFYRIGVTYSREKEWEKAAKSYTTAIKLNNENANSFLALGNCLLELDAPSDAVNCFYAALKLKPNNKTIWVALIKSLITSELYEEALLQLESATKSVGKQPDFDFYHAGICFAQGKSKEALLYLEKGLAIAPQKIKLLIEIQPDLLQRKSVANLVALYKKKSK